MAGTRRETTLRDLAPRGFHPDPRALGRTLIGMDAMPSCQRHERSVVRHTAPVLRKSLLVAAVVLLLAIGAIGLRTVQVHQETGEWRPSPSAAPSVIHVDGREYRRGGLAPEPPRGTIDVEAVGRTAGGALIFIPPGTSGGGVPTVLHVYDDPKIWAYELVSGP